MTPNKSRVKSTRKNFKKHNGGGHILQLELPKIGGQAVNMGYDQCCPPVYQNGEVAYNPAGNRLCGGGKRKNIKSKSKSKRTKLNKSKRTKSRKSRKSYK